MAAFGLYSRPPAVHATAACVVMPSSSKPGSRLMDPLSPRQGGDEIKIRMEMAASGVMRDVGYGSSKRRRTAISPSQSRASPAANFPCGSEVTRSSLMSNRGTTQHGRMWMRACTLILPALLTASCMAPTATPAASDRATATPAAITTPPATGPGSPTPASRTFRSATGRWSASMPVAWFSEESSGRAIIRSYDPSQAAFESAPGAAESGPDVPTQRCASSLR